MAGKFVITAILLWPVLLMCSMAQEVGKRDLAGKASDQIPAFVYGTWRIHKLEEVGGHAGEAPDVARKEIGRKIRFGRKAVAYDGDFLFFDPPCRRVSYTFEEHKIGKYEAGRNGTLNFHGLSPARESRSLNVIVRCNGRPRYYFELAKDNELAIYYDGWFFFLKKVSE